MDRPAAVSDELQALAEAINMALADRKTARK
jgi:hypothetical protein